MTDPARTALLMIECQRGVVGDLSVLPDLAAAARPILETIGRLAREARQHGVSVVHLTYAPLAEGRSTNQRSQLTRATAVDRRRGVLSDREPRSLPSSGSNRETWSSSDTRASRRCTAPRCSPCSATWGSTRSW